MPPLFAEDDQGMDDHPVSAYQLQELVWIWLVQLRLHLHCGGTGPHEFRAAVGKPELGTSVATGELGR